MKWAGVRNPKVQLTVYVAPEVKRGLKMIANLAGSTTSKVVEELCRELLEQYPDIMQLVKKGG